jgi:hypothetical protein
MSESETEPVILWSTDRYLVPTVRTAEVSFSRFDFLTLLHRYLRTAECHCAENAKKKF